MAVSADGYQYHRYHKQPQTATNNLMEMHLIGISFFPFFSEFEKDLLHIWMET